jgi:hypothetical protein
MRSRGRAACWSGTCLARATLQPEGTPANPALLASPAVAGLGATSGKCRENPSAADAEIVEGPIRIPSDTSEVVKKGCLDLYQRRRPPSTDGPLTRARFGNLFRHRNNADCSDS